MLNIREPFKMCSCGGEKRRLSRRNREPGWWCVWWHAALDNGSLTCKMEVSRCGSNSVVECHLAKVKVASSNLVSRSKFFGSAQAIAQRAALVYAARST